MANLTERLDEIEGILNVNHTQLGVWLAAIGLDVAGISPTISAMEANLLASLATLNTSLTGLNTLITAGNTTLTAMNGRLGLINTSNNAINTNTGITASYIDDIAAAVANIYAAVGVPASPDAGTVLFVLNQVYLALDALNTNFGEAGDPTETLLELMQSVRTCICAVAGELPSEPTTPECEEPFVSTGQVFIPTWIGFGSGVTVAKWSEPLPAGIEFGSIFGLGEDATELHAELGFAGSLIWVESGAPVFAISPLDIVRYPTNQWVVLPETQDIAISVDADHGLTAYLCAEFDVCIQAETFEIFSQAFSTPYVSAEIDLDGHYVLWVSYVGNPGDAVTFNFYMDGELQFTDVAAGSGEERLIIKLSETCRMEATGGTNGFWRVGYCTGG